jgi:hypothetical protein
MISRARIAAAAPAALKHFSLSLLVAGLCAALVFGLWYPYPFREISGGRELFTLLMAVDVVIGPLLTLVVYNPSKSSRELWRDIGVIVALQLAALAYGLHTVMQARPAFLSFEGNRFRAVSVAEIDPGTLHEAPPDLRRLSLVGPGLIAARLAKETDADFLDSIKQSMRGLHPSLRPARWATYDSQRELVKTQAQPLAVLRRKQAQSKALIDAAVNDANLPEARLGFLPLVSRTRTDWVVLVSLEDGQPRAYAPVDGW